MARTWRELHLAAMAEARRAHRELDIDITQRIDPFAALKRSGVLVFRRPLDRIAGAYLPGTSDTDEQPGVLINASQPLSRQRYTAAHELSHHRRDRRLVLDLDTEWLERGERPETEVEQFAEAFAAWFLMPQQLIETKLETLGLRITELDAQGAYALALELGTSYAATVNHLADLRLIRSPLRKKLLKVSPQVAKRATGAIGVAADAWKDVWLVRPPRPTAISAQEGDIIIVEVTEIPSNGYIWQPRDVPVGLSYVRDEYVPAHEGMLGGQGSHRFLFRVETAGRQPLRFELSRPWQPENIVETIAMDVVAQPQPTSGIVLPEQLIMAA